MKLIELHILQSFPVSCLNRDDVGGFPHACGDGPLYFAVAPTATLSLWFWERADLFFYPTLGV